MPRPLLRAALPSAALLAASAACFSDRTTGLRGPLPTDVDVLASNAVPPGYGDSAVVELGANRTVVVRGSMPEGCTNVLALAGWVLGGENVAMTITPAPIGCVSTPGGLRWYRVTLGPLPAGRRDARILLDVNPADETVEVLGTVTVGGS